jgi:hypothetical protein
MGNRLIRYILIVFGLALLWISTSRSAMQYLSEKRDIKNRWWGVDELDHGDLASISYLNFVEKFAQPVTFPAPLPAAYNGPKNTILFLDGDSYTRHMSDTLFAGVNELVYIDRNHGTKFHLDTSKRNVLLIEISERYVRPYFGDLKIFNEVYDSVTINKSACLSPNQRVHEAALLGSFSLDNLFNKYINQNIQFNLFNYQFMMPMFGSKAAINYYLFDRASGDVVISKDKKHLFLKETVSLTDIGSSYIPLSDDDINILINNFNSIYDHYKTAGFSEVYLSIIPNSATINQPEGYNNLTPRVQYDKRLKMKIIDAYAAFKTSGAELYLTGDTHWNHKGKQLWLNLVNKQLVN